MKQGNAYQALVMTILAIGMVCYFGFHVFNSMYNPLSTVYAYEFSMSETVEVNGIVVRDEHVLPSYDGLVEARIGEGERVGAHHTVALVYDDAQAQDNQSRLRALEQEYEIVRYVLEVESDMLSSAHLDEMIIQSVVDLRVASATEDYGKLDAEVLDLKSAMLKRAYTYDTDLDPNILKTRKSELQAESKSLSTRTAAATTRVIAPKSGLYSSFVDGYEQEITPDTMYDISPSDLDYLLKLGLTGDSRSVGKLILGNLWYLVLSVPESAADKLEEGNTILVRFTGDVDKDIPMQIEQVGVKENGLYPVVLSSDRHMSDITILRDQTIELVYDIQSGIRVPKDTLRMETRTKVDKETGEEYTTQTLGVYAVVGQQAEFKPVTTIAEGKDFYVVKPAEEGKTALRSGDELIIYAKELYDGKPVR